MVFYLNVWSFYLIDLQRFINPLPENRDMNNNKAMIVLVKMVIVQFYEENYLAACICV